jgi:hypothetical protein
MRLLVQPLFDGSLDIVGDIHGEIDALQGLLGHLGYRAGEHPQGRRLVFVGDLCDRGPDSVAVVELVQELVERQLAQCILGNHELNVLRGDHKHGNRWILDPGHPENAEEFSCRTASPRQRDSIVAFFRTLPMALERSDLRVVHATWHDGAIATLRASSETNIEAFTRFEAEMKRVLDDTGIRQAGKDELAPHRQGLDDPDYAMPLLSTVGRCEEQRQMLNPVRVLTSGPERATARPFFATGKWRFCDRVKWWDEYTSATPVIFGHYWRRTCEERDVSGGKPDLFEGIGPRDWTGPQRSTYCADFSVGGRFRERKQRPGQPFTTRLAAVRWPERTVTFDDGERIRTT